MYALLGVANTNPASFMQGLRKYLSDEELDAATYRPTLLGFDEWPEQVKGVVMVPTVALLLQRLPQLAKAPVVVIVFDTALLLEYVPACTALDVVPKTQSFRYTFKPLDYGDAVRRIDRARREREHVTVSPKDLSVIPTLLGQTQASLLSPILTWLYSIKDTNARHQHMRTIYGWMRGDGNVDALSEQLPGSKSCARLVEWFSQDVGVRTVKAVREMVRRKSEGKTANLEKIAKTHGVTLFDLKYIAQMLQKLDLSATSA